MSGIKKIEYAIRLTRSAGVAFAFCVPLLLFTGAGMIDPEFPPVPEKPGFMTMLAAVVIGLPLYAFIFLTLSHFLYNGMVYLLVRYYLRRRWSLKDILNAYELSLDEEMEISDQESDEGVIGLELRLMEKIRKRRVNTIVAAYGSWGQGQLL